MKEKGKKKKARQHYSSAPQPCISMTPHSSPSAHRRQQAAPLLPGWGGCCQQDRLKLLSPPLCRDLPAASPQTEGLMRGIDERLARSALPACCKRWEGLRCISSTVRKQRAVTACTKPCPHPYVSIRLLVTFLSVCCRQVAVEEKRSHWQCQGCSACTAPSRSAWRARFGGLRAPTFL